jgi:Ca2+-binding RTX toxin-like protein
MAIIGGPVTGTGILRGTAIDFTSSPTGSMYDNYGDTITVTPSSLIGTLVFGDLYDPRQFNTEGDDIFGGAGDDSIYGDTGPDPMYGDALWQSRTIGGTDRIKGNAGADLIFGGGAYDLMFGGTGGDRLYGDAGGDGCNGDAGSDTVYGGVGDDQLAGGDGRDTIFGGIGHDTIAGENTAPGNVFARDLGDVIYGGANNDTVAGGNGDDLIFGGSGRDVVDGGGAFHQTDQGADTLYGGDGRDTVLGSLGRDDLFGGAAADRLVGGDGRDHLNGGLGRDLLIGGDNGDSFVFDSALRPDSNVDTIIGWDATDTVVLDNDIFAALGAAFTLAEFRAINMGTSFASVDDSDNIIYVKETGRLYYDADGSGSAAHTLFAVVDAGTMLTFADFMLIT